MILSLVSGTFNRLESLKMMVDSARANFFRGLTYEIILVDGGSTDGTLEWAEQQIDIKLIRQGKLLGAIAAFNAGARAAQGDYVLLANDDIVFEQNSIWPAIMHLETYPDCGAVAFADNRPLPNWSSARHKVQVVPTTTGQFVPYAQVGLFRRWLGDLCGWWGSEDPAFGGYTYGGDNYLSARIWEYGFSVDRVEGCQVDDNVLNDELRAFNVAEERERGESAYHKLWPNGIELNKYEKPEASIRRHARVLYLPIYEPRPPQDPARIAQLEQKRGLRDALAARYIVRELDYLAVPEGELEKTLGGLLASFAPDLVLTQVHGYRPLTVGIMAHLRAIYPRPVWVNWNGDYWPDGLISPAMLELLRYWDVQTTVNASVLDTYAQHGIPAAYWQIGVEETPEPEGTAQYDWDVIFLANNYSDARANLGRELKALPYRVALFGEHWGKLGEGKTTLYDFAAGAALYNRARIAISDNQFPEAEGYVSNRLFQALAAGNTTIFQQHIEGLEEWTGLIAGVHYVEWFDVNGLQNLLATYLNPANESALKLIGKTGYAFVKEHHSFAARVEELRIQILPLARHQPVDHIILRYTGSSPTGAGGVMGLQGRHYVHTGPESLLHVDPLDADWICTRFPFERAGMGKSKLEV